LPIDLHHPISTDLHSPISTDLHRPISTPVPMHPELPADI
jgi:hypothetical protein